MHDETAVKIIGACQKEYNKHIANIYNPANAEKFQEPSVKIAGKSNKTTADSVQATFDLVNESSSDDEQTKSQYN